MVRDNNPKIHTYKFYPTKKIQFKRGKSMSRTTATADTKWGKTADDQRKPNTQNEKKKSNSIDNQTKRDHTVTIITTEKKICQTSPAVTFFWDIETKYSWLSCANSDEKEWHHQIALQNLDKRQRQRQQKSAFVFFVCIEICLHSVLLLCVVVFDFRSISYLPSVCEV